MSLKRAVRLLLIAAVAALMVCSTAWAKGVAASGYQAADYATGFPESTSNGWGPIGVAFDHSDNLYVGDLVDGNIYRFPPGGGVASAATRITHSPISGDITGLAFSRSGALYVARNGAQDVIQVDPNSGKVIRTVADVPCATGLAVDPISGDLFVSDKCGTMIWRVSNFASGTGTVTPYSTVSAPDGLAFDQDGTLYAAGAGNVTKIDGTNSATPGVGANTAQVPSADGLAFGAHATGGPPYLVANRNDGIVTRVDFGSAGSTEQNIFSGGSRGDFAAVDSHGCLYITQSTSIVRITSADGTCAFEPTTPGATLSPVPGTGGHPTCKLMRSLKVRLHFSPKRVRRAIIYINGKRIRTVRGRALRGTIRLAHLPSRAFTLKIVRVMKTGHKKVTRRFHANCHPRHR